MVQTGGVMNALSVATNFRQGIIPPFAIVRDVICEFQLTSIIELESIRTIHEHALQEQHRDRNTSARRSRFGMGCHQSTVSDWYVSMLSRPSTNAPHHQSIQQPRKENCLLSSK